MAIVIKPSGEEQTVTPRFPKKGFTLEELYKLIGCDCIEVVPLADRRKMVVDEDGLGKNLEANRRATDLYQVRRGFVQFPIVGTVVVCESGELK